jgi:hypothetical protein
VSSLQLVEYAAATLFVPTTSSAFGTARGDQHEGSFEYRAGSVRILLGSGPGHVRGTVTVDGLVLDESASPTAVAHRDVRLLAGDALVQDTRTDNLGGFTFEGVAAGTYRLEIALSDQVVVVENLPVATNS